MREQVISTSIYPFNFLLSVLVLRKKNQMSFDMEWKKDNKAFTCYTQFVVGVCKPASQPARLLPLDLYQLPDLPSQLLESIYLCKTSLRRSKTEKDIQAQISKRGVFKWCSSCCSITITSHVPNILRQSEKIHSPFFVAKSDSHHQNVQGGSWLFGGFYFFIYCDPVKSK